MYPFLVCPERMDFFIFNVPDAMDCLFLFLSLSVLKKYEADERFEQVACTDVSGDGVGLVVGLVGLSSVV